MSDATAALPASSTWRDHASWPDVDIVMPIRNEAPHLDTA
ncbi:MAG: hypothetical protein ACI8V4_003259, partial [Ilumatobacter sp.]